MLVGCGVDNLASNKTIKAFRGFLERTEIDPNDNTESNIYWINVDESLEKNKTYMTNTYLKNKV